MHLKKLSVLAVFFLSLGLTGCGSDNLDQINNGSSGTVDTGDSSDDSTDGSTDDNSDSSTDDNIYTATGNFVINITEPNMRKHVHQR